MKRRASKSAKSAAKSKSTKQPVAKKATPKPAAPVVASPTFGDAKTGTLVPGPRGGMLRRGGTNKGGTGRPPSALRERLRGSFEQRVTVLEDVADGVPMVRTKVRIADVIPHICCATCGESVLEPKDKDAAPFIEIAAQTSASPKDRILALDGMAKYGLGPVPQEIKGKFTGKFEVRVVVKREGRRITSS